jgi:hypothetical protein
MSSYFYAPLIQIWIATVLTIYCKPGIDVMIFKIFSPKILAEKLVFFTQNYAKLCKNWIKTLAFEKNAVFFAENCQKLQKIVIITLTPGAQYLFIYEDII